MNESFRTPLCKTNYFSLVTKYLIGINLKREGFLWIIVEGNHPTIMKILASGMVAGGGG